jgi:hypothetical protein
MKPSFAPSKTFDRPLADAGYESYRYEGDFGWIMIGAVGHAQALSEANRSLSRKDATMSHLQVWSGTNYVAATHDNDPQVTVARDLDRCSRPSNRQRQAT